MGWIYTRTVRPKIIQLVLIFIGLTCATQVVSGQTEADWEKLYEQGKAHYNNDQNELAKSVFEKALIIAQNQFTTEDWQLAHTAYFLGQVYTSLDLWEDAVKVQQIDSASHAIRNGIESTNYAQTLANLAESYARLSGKGKHAEKLLALAFDNIAEQGSNLNKDENELLLTLLTAYLHLGNYKQLKILAEIARVSSERLGGKQDINYAHVLGILSDVYERDGDYQMAYEASHKAYQIIKSTYPEEFQVLAATQLGLGQKLEELGKYEEALKFIEEALSNTAKGRGELSIVYAVMLHEKARIYDEYGKSREAVVLYKQALQIIRSRAGAGHDYYYLIMGNLANAYSVLSEHQEATKLSKMSLKDAKDRYGTNNLEYAVRSRNLGNVFHRQGYFDKAQEQYQISLKIVEEQLGKLSTDYATNLSQLAELYHEKGDLELALNTHLEALEIKEKILGKDHPDYGSGLNNLGSVYFSLGEYEKAHDALLKALDNAESFFGVNSLDYSRSVNNLAVFYNRLGQHQRALEAYEKGSQIVKSLIGSDNDQYASSINNQALAHFKLGNIEKGEVMMTEAIAIAKNTGRTNHPDYAIRLQNMAMYHAKIQEYDEAFDLFFEALQTLTNLYGEDHHMIGHLSGLVSETYRMAGYYELAFATNLRAQYSISNSLGRQNIRYARILLQSASINKSLGKKRNAMNALLKSNPLLFEHLNSVFNFSTENEKKALIEQMKWTFYSHQSLNYLAKHEYDELTINNLNNVLALKGLLLKTTKDVLKALRQSEDPEVLELLKSLQQTKSLLSRLELKPNRNENYYDSLKKHKELQESNIARLWDESTDANQIGSDWKVIQSNLKPNEIAIEFSQFQYDARYNWSDSILYIAYLLKPEWAKPKVISLFEKRELINALKSQNINKVYQTRGGKSERLTKNAEAQLYELIWEPLEPYLKKVKTIYYSPDGALHQLSTAAISDKKNKKMINRFNLIQMNTTQSIAKSEQLFTMTDALLIGGINYDYSFDSATPHTPSELTLALNRPVNTRGNLKPGTQWDYLKGSKTEVDALGDLLKNHGKPYETWSSSEANEAQFKSLNGRSPSVIHIATHGFFFENKNKMRESELEQPSYSLADDPLIRSGLVMAGGNYAWQNGNNPYEEEDGILTALEIANLDLSKTKLVVLSACDTGLGDIDGSEGVYGLQRAFRMAGVDNIIMSLWEVADKETAEFMKTFYERWLGGTSLRKAFNETQRAMAKKYKNEPKKWAGFVLLS